MAFPQTPLPVVVQALLDGVTWTDITAKTYTRSSVTITRGKPNEGSSAEPSSVEVVLNNKDGRFSPRNPAGPYYGQIGRGTQLRVGITESSGWLNLPGPIGVTPGSGQYLTTSDKAALDITGDIDLRFDADLDSWRQGMELISKWNTSGNQRSYALHIDGDGYLRLSRSTDGTLANAAYAQSTVPVPIRRGRLAVRGVLDVNNGAGGRTTTFYTAPTLAGPWTQLGASLTGTPNITIFAGTAPVYLLDNPNADIWSSTSRGRVFGAEIRNGIGGTLVASPDFTTQTDGATSFADAQSNTWSLTGVELTHLNVRGHGEVAAWPTEWDGSQNDVWATVKADGIMRRLGQGEAPLRSSLYRAILDDEFVGDVVAYWPMEDLDGATHFASALTNGRAMFSLSRILSGAGITSADDDTQFAAYSGFGGSAPIATFGDKSAWSGPVPTYTGSGTASVWAIVGFPAAGGLTATTDIFRVNMSGGLAQVVVRYGVGGTLEMRCYDTDGALLVTSGALAYNVDGKDLKVSIELEVSGGNTSVKVATLEPGAVNGAVSGVTVTGTTFSKVTSVYLAARRTANGVSIGHVSVQRVVPSLFDLRDPFNGWRGETAGRRIQRLCVEEGVPLVAFGDLDDTVPVGFQTPAAFLDLLEQAADADGGQLAEARDTLAISYCPRSAIEGQPADLSLPYSVARDLKPVEDDSGLTNDVEVVRAAGSSYRVEATEGRLSTADPPSGAGRYASTQTLNLAYDEQLPGRAGLALRIGTVDEARYPTIAFDLEHPSISGNATRTAAARRVDLGDRLTITGPLPLWIAPDDIDQVVLGTKEELGVFEHTLTLNATPYAPYRSGVYDVGVGRDQARYDIASTCYLFAGVNSTATTLVFVTPGTAMPWTVDPTSYPFDVRIAGERITLNSAPASSTSPQTFTGVTRSVNGVVKSLPSGSSVSLADPIYYRI